MAVSVGLAIQTAIGGLLPDGISDLKAERDGDAIVVSWSVARDARVAGLKVARTDPAGRTLWSSGALIPAPLQLRGVGRSETREENAPLTDEAYYVLTAVSLTGEAFVHGPLAAAVTPYVSKRRAPLIAARSVDVGSDKAAPVVQFIGGDGDRLKLLVDQPGLYEITAEEIAAGLGSVASAGAASFLIGQTNLALSSCEETVAWVPAPLNAGLLFYADVTPTIYSEQAAYWLELGRGTLMAAVSGQGGTAASGDFFLSDMSFEEDVRDFFTADVFYGTHDDPWVWSALFLSSGAPTGSAVFSLDLPNAITGLAGEVRVRLKGYSDLYADGPDLIDHHVRLYVNGSMVGETNWNGFALASPVFGVTNFVAGANEVRVEGVLEPGLDFGYVLIDGFDVSYPREYVALGNGLSFGGVAATNVTVHDLTTTNVHLLEVSDPLQPTVVTDLSVAPTNGAFDISFRRAAVTGAYHLATAPIPVGSIQSVNASGWRTLTGGVEHIVIAPMAWAPEADRLVMHRRAQGLSSTVVPLEEIYNEFGCGLASPWAIRDFLQHAWSNWVPTPRYVVLAGAGTYDYLARQQLELEDPNVIPVPMVEADGAVYGADQPLVEFTGDDVPELALGRFPVVNSNELAGLIDKIVAYESGGDWKQNVALLADNLDPKAGDFTASCDALASRVPPFMGVDRNYLDTQSVATVKTRLLGALNEGCMLYSYMGHANMDQIADENLLQHSDLPSLTNGTRAAVFTALTCQLSRFGLPNTSYNPGHRALGEALVQKGDGGVVALWAPVSESYNAEGTDIGSRFLDGIFLDRLPRIGDSILAALADYKDGTPGFPFLLRTFALLGDPATVVAPPGFSYESWAQQWFSGGDLLDPLISGRDADPDSNGVPNSVAFAMNWNPTNGEMSVVLEPHVETVVEGGVTSAQGNVTFPWRKWTEGVSYGLEVCDNLMTQAWATGEGVVELSQVEDVDDAMDRHTIRLVEPLEAPGSLFARLRLWWATPE